jgi:hypothetical protein
LIIFASYKTRRSAIRPQQMNESLNFPRALAVVASILKRGRATHVGQDWRELPAGFHVARAQRHLDLLARGDMTEPHLAHAAARLLMALELDAELRSKDAPSAPPRS